MEEIGKNAGLLFVQVRNFRPVILQVLSISVIVTVRTVVVRINFEGSGDMVSRTCVTRNKREKKKTKQGKRRKAANNTKGTTPKFAIHLEKTDK